MRILIVTPLYPPDIAPLALYVKEVAERLSKHAEVTILTYGHIPEVIKGVRIVHVEKNRPLLIRLRNFFRAFQRERDGMDIVYVQNGASVEFPVLASLLLCRMPTVLNLYDIKALQNAQRHLIQRYVLALLMKLSTRVLYVDAVKFPHRHEGNIVRMPTIHERPEILPFAARAPETLHAYETGWQTHSTKLIEVLNHVIA